MTLLRDFFSQTHTQPCCFHPLGVYTNPPPPVPPFLLTLNQSPKEIAGGDITNCLTRTMYAKAFKVAWELCRHWRFELILSHAETYHVFLKTILFISFLYNSCNFQYLILLLRHNNDDVIMHSWPFTRVASFTITLSLYKYTRIQYTLAINIRTLTGDYLLNR